uniref:S8 family serine peptidase n=1 Tax=Salegentibacter sp. TaxID=1903072 RepID=UPI0035640B0B
MKNVWITRLQTALLLLFVFALFQSCSKEMIEEDALETVSNASISDKDLIEGHYIVIVSEKPAKRNAKAAAVLEELSKELKSKPGARLKQTYKHALTGFAAELTDKQVRKLERDPRVESVEQDGYIYLDNTVNVQENCTWGLDRIDQRGSLLDRAYASTATGEGVTAYIMDSGIRYSHDEFGGRASLGYDFVVSEDPADTDPNQAPGEDCMGHGTHVAGTVGGSGFGV